MSVNDPIGDMLARIRNASLRNKSSVRTPASKIRKCAAVRGLHPQL
jgi:small subunit ribosomal protein S8